MRFNFLTRSVWLALSVLLLGAQNSAAQTLELPATGVWNGFNQQLNILECTNASDVSYDFSLIVKSNAGGVIGSQALNLPPYGTAHIPLNGFGITDSYGTFRLEHASGTFQADSPLNCATVVYRLSAIGATKAVDYAFALPVRKSLQGSSAGIFNSMNPEGQQRPVQNWLSVYNSGDAPMSASVEIINSDGSEAPGASFFVSDLQPGERRDFGIGHPFGQSLGLYRIIPSDPQSKYGAFITRYALDNAGRFKFAFPVFAEQGGCNVSVPASTMDPAINWGEIANAGDTDLPVLIEIRDPFGNVKYREGTTLPPRSQKHVYVNASLGERQVGTIDVQCVSGNLLVQSAYYGYRASTGPLVEWAYISQARQLKAGEGDRSSFLVNTFLGAANWNKYLDSSQAPSWLNTSYFDQSGGSVARTSKVLFASGGLDLGAHEQTGANFVGQSLSYSSTSSARMSSEMLRVFPDSRGGIGAIFNLPPRVIAASEKQKGAIRLANDGHYLEFRKRKIHVVGDSITQGWMELGRDFNTTSYLDNLQAQGVNTLMIWSFIAIVNQAQDSRVGYHAPRLWPWQELSGSVVPPYHFEYLDPQFRAKFNEEYFRALTALVKAANERDILVLITVHDGWTKDRFAGHPLYAANGGTIASNRDYVSIADYANELPRTFTPGWDSLHAHQFVLERFSDRLIRATADYPNVMYEMFNEGEWYDQNLLRAFQSHFLDFFESRTDLPLLVNDDHVGGDSFIQDGLTDVITLHLPNWGAGTSAKSAFDYYAPRFNGSNPLKRPIFFDEPVPEYRGEPGLQNGLMRLMWGTLLAGAGYFMPNDSSWKFNPSVIDNIFLFESNASVFFNELGIDFSSMSPDGGCASSGVCLSRPGNDYLIYAQGLGSSNPPITINLAGLSGSFQVRFYSPRTGVFDTTVLTVSGGSASTSITRPNADDWVVWVKRVS